MQNRISLDLYQALPIAIIWHECEPLRLLETRWKENAIRLAGSGVRPLTEWTLAHGSRAVHADSLLALETAFRISFNIYLVKGLTTEVYDFKVSVHLELVGLIDEFIFA